jgi:hypothetical protein
MKSPLVPIGVLVGFSWIVALALALSGAPSKRAALGRDLVDRMCACTTMRCIEDVQYEAARLPRDDEPQDAIRLEQQLGECKRKAVRKVVE